MKTTSKLIAFPSIEPEVNSENEQKFSELDENARMHPIFKFKLSGFLKRAASPKVKINVLKNVI